MTLSRRHRITALLLGACCGLSAAATPAPAARVALGDDDVLRVDGKPFVPIFAWAVPRRRIAFNKELGINAIVPGEQPAKEGPRTELLADLHAQGMMAMLDASEYSAELAAHPALLCWKFGDEPDMKGVKAPALAQKAADIRSKDPHHPVWINLTSRFYTPYYEGDKPNTKWPNRDEYRAYADVCDIASYDHYPITGWNKPGRVAELYHATVEFLPQVPARTHWVIVESADQDLQWTPKETRGPTPDETRAMVWMSIVGGARGIGYFHIAFNPFRWDNLTPEMKKELPGINALVTDLAAPIAAGEAVEGSVDTEDVVARAVRHDGALYVFAVNLAREERSATITLPSVKRKAQAEALREDRTVAVEKGALKDSFGPLGVHCYRIAMR